MDPQNPYAPPVESADVALPPQAPTPGLTLSEQGWATVTSLAKWMRIVSVFFYVGGALFAVASLVALVSGGSLLAGGGSGLAAGGIFGGSLAMILLTFLLFFAGAWLRQAAYHFYDGVLSNAESALAEGFRKLRLFMILYGIYYLMQLVSSVYQMFSLRNLGGE